MVEETADLSLTETPDQPAFTDFDRHLSVVSVREGGQTPLCGE